MLRKIILDDDCGMKIELLDNMRGGVTISVKNRHNEEVVVFLEKDQAKELSDGLSLLSKD